MKNFNGISIVSGIIGGTLSFLFGSFDILLKVLITVIIIDIITGLIKAIYNKELSSKIMLNGLLKKIGIFCVFSLSVVLQKIVNLPLREVMGVFFIANEGLSICENLAVFNIIPEKLKNVLLQLRGDENEF